MDHETFMFKCLELARIARANGESPVGSVMVHNNQIIAEGIEAVKTRKDITCHAEMEAIRQAVHLLNKNELAECTLYSTHEPCVMCSYAIRHYRIANVITALSGGITGGYSSKFPILTDDTISVWGKPPTVVEGILEEEGRRLYS